MRPLVYENSITSTPGSHRKSATNFFSALLIATPRGGEAMMEVLEQVLTCHAADGLLENHGSTCQ